MFKFFKNYCIGVYRRHRILLNIAFDQGSCFMIKEVQEWDPLVIPHHPEKADLRELECLSLGTGEVLVRGNTLKK